MGKIDIRDNDGECRGDIEYILGLTKIKLKNGRDKGITTIVRAAVSSMRKKYEELVEAAEDKELGVEIADTYLSSKLKQLAKGSQ